jgi:hypothetical protein
MKNPDSTILHILIRRAQIKRCGPVARARGFSAVLLLGLHAPDSLADTGDGGAGGPAARS